MVLKSSSVFEKQAYPLIGCIGVKPGSWPRAANIPKSLITTSRVNEIGDALASYLTGDAVRIGYLI